MDSKKIVEKSEETIKTLTAIWDELGLEDAIRRQHLAALTKKLESVFEELLTQEQAVRDQYKSNVERYKVKIQDICRILEEPQPNFDSMNAEGLMNTFGQLAEVLEALYRKRDERVDMIKRMNEKMLTLCNELNISPKVNENENENVSTKRIEQIEKEIAKLEEEKKRRGQMIRALVQSIVRLFSALELTPTTEYEQRILNYSEGALGYTFLDLQKLEDKEKELYAECKRREGIVKESRLRIAALWERLKIPEEERQTFLKKMIGVGQSVLEKWRNEVARLEEQKSQQMKQIIEDVRAQIVAVWDELKVAPTERQLFQAFSSKEYTDEILQIHEEMLKKLQHKLEAARPLLRLIERRERIRQEKIELQQLTSDPKRLLDTKKSAAFLLREEKLRRKIEKELPKLEEQLRVALLEWPKANNGEVFTWNGENYLAIMKLQEEEERRYKQELKAKKEKRKQERTALVSSNGAEKENVQANASIKQIKSKTPLPSKQISRTVSVSHLTTPSLLRKRTHATMLTNSSTNQKKNFPITPVAMENTKRIRLAESEPAFTPTKFTF
jgi:protein regulator of cytokinesis 1